MGESLSCALVDDDGAFRATLREYVQRSCSKAGIQCSVDDFGDPYDLIEDYEPRYDVVFLDIEMPHLDGMELARRIRAIDERVCIIFVTNMARFALNGYEVNATDFIVKPVTYDAFAIKFARALRFVSLHRERDVLLQDDERTVRVPHSAIQCIEKNRNYAVYRTDLGDFLRRITLHEAASELDDPAFVQVNSGILVNLARVRTYTRTEVVLDSGPVPLSRSRRAGFVDAFMDYLGG